MRIHGWCQVCRRVKIVRVLWFTRPGVFIGICSACERDKR